MIAKGTRVTIDPDTGLKPTAWGFPDDTPVRGEVIGHKHGFNEVAVTSPGGDPAVYRPRGGFDSGWLFSDDEVEVI